MKHLTSFTLLTVLSGIAASIISAQDVASVMANLQRHYRETKTVRAAFSEAITPAGSPTRTRTGTLYLSKPGKMRWEFEAPQKELVVSDGTTVYSYDPDLNQVVETSLKQALQAPGATEFLLGVGDVTRDFTGALGKSTGDGLLHLTLTPKHGGDPIALGLDGRTYDIHSLQITDQLGNVTAITFSNIVKNPTVADSLFQFTVPQGADIVNGSPTK